MENGNEMELNTDNEYELRNYLTECVQELRIGRLRLGIDQQEIDFEIRNWFKELTLESGISHKKGNDHETSKRS